MKRYVRESSDTLKASFDQALRRHKVRKFDNCRLILSALAYGPAEGLLHNEVLAKIRETVPQVDFRTFWLPPDDAWVCP